MVQEVCQIPSCPLQILFKQIVLETDQGQRLMGGPVDGEKSLGIETRR